mmetsp:Transcript_20962/g.67506  ORF Transcript_20962/g.67506 Transcript_20962/m.67506 type:complete len:240 (+) Transcript_20962:2671-3390(+)
MTSASAPGDTCGSSTSACVAKWTVRLVRVSTSRLAATLCSDAAEWPIKCSEGSTRVRPDKRSSTCTVAVPSGSPSAGPSGAGAASAAVAAARPASIARSACRAQASATRSGSERSRSRPRRTRKATSRAREEPVMTTVKRARSESGWHSQRRPRRRWDSLNTRLRILTSKPSLYSSRWRRPLAAAAPPAPPPAPPLADPAPAPPPAPALTCSPNEDTEATLSLTAWIGRWSRCPRRSRP